MFNLHKNKTVLLVEDNDINSLLFEKIFQKLEITVIKADNGLVAVEKFLNNINIIDFIFMDVLMPQMDGVEAAQQIKKIKKNIPIIGQTAIEKYEELDMSVFDAILYKPFHYEKVKNILNFFF